jgi:iron-sulfur cluster assembly protein
VSDSVETTPAAPAASAAPATAAPAPAPSRRPARPRPAPIKVTPAAVERVKALVAKRGKPSFGVRVGVRTRGCSGLSYTLEYADQANPGDEVVELGTDLRVLIDPKASMFLFGTEMDYVEEKLQSGFTFRNPNEKGRCGCGESFHV